MLACREGGGRGGGGRTSTAPVTKLLLSCRAALCAVCRPSAARPRPGAPVGWRRAPRLPRRPSRPSPLLPKWVHARPGGPLAMGPHLCCQSGCMRVLGGPLPCAVAAGVLHAWHKAGHGHTTRFCLTLPLPPGSPRLQALFHKAGHGHTTVLPDAAAAPWVPPPPPAGAVPRGGARRGLLAGQPEAQRCAGAHRALPGGAGRARRGQDPGGGGRGVVGTLGPGPGGGWAWGGGDPGARTRGPGCVGWWGPWGQDPGAGGRGGWGLWGQDTGAGVRGVVGTPGPGACVALVAALCLGRLVGAAPPCTPLLTHSLWWYEVSSDLLPLLTRRCTRTRSRRLTRTTTRQRRRRRADGCRKAAQQRWQEPCCTAGRLARASACTSLVWPWVETQSAARERASYKLVRCAAR
jgi:hypothetical protein